MSGEGGVPAPGLEAEPALVLVLPDPHVLPGLTRPLPQPLAQGRPALVQGRLLVFVLQEKSIIMVTMHDLVIMFLSPHLNCDQSAGPDEVLGDVGVAPEAGVVEGGVTVLVNKVHICLMPEKLKNGWVIISRCRVTSALTVCTTSRCPCAAPRCRGVSSPMLVVCTRAPRPINISRIFR